ncbi:MAG: hypothetical protein FJ387_08815 [Verrucomicrobia bacterium]|nr:hypothetical protein [Verrucomicrobiota bacterium]
MNESSNSWSEQESGSLDSDVRLPLPDWSGQMPRSSRVPTDEWRRYCRANLGKLRSRPGYAERRLRNGIAEEFSFRSSKGAVPNGA